jgi:hypothetical protein
VLVFWLFVVGVVMVFAVIVLWALLTVEVTPAHSRRPPTATEKARRAIRGMVRRQPAGKRELARRDARRGEWSARLTRLRGLLRSPGRPVEDVQLPPLVADVTPEEPSEPEPAPAAGDEQIDLTESPTDEDWAATLRMQVAAEAKPGPNDHLRRNWPDDGTGTWKRGMIEQMTADGQMPPPDPSAEPGTPADAFMGSASAD